MPKTDLHSSSIALLKEADRAEIVSQLTGDDALSLLYDWPFWARPSQLAPLGEWYVWLILAGRGWGKTRVGAEWVRYQVEQGGKRRIALVGRTAADVRDVMVEGESGLMAVCPQDGGPEYQPSKRRVVWPNGAIATTYSGDQPDQLRGPQHDGGWADELAAWRYPDAWDQLMFGMRLGDRPQVVVTTTPRPTQLVKQLAARKSTVVTTGHTLENRAHLAPTALAELLDKYENTRLGRQELNAEILEDNPGALWTRGRIEALRVRSAPALRRIVVAIDPAATSGGDETGIVVAGVAADGQGYVLDDLTLQGSPHAWATVAVNAYRAQQADRIVAETNNGGEMVEHTVRTVDPNVSYRAVHASRGKITRAEPIAALYEQGKVHHVGMFAELEDQMCDWSPSSGQASPDRMDALVWALTELMLDGQVDGQLFY